MNARTKKQINNKN